MNKEVATCPAPDLSLLSFHPVNYEGSKQQSFPTPYLIFALISEDILLTILLCESRHFTAHNLWYAFGSRQSQTKNIFKIDKHSRDDHWLVSRYHFWSGQMTILWPFYTN